MSIGSVYHGCGVSRFFFATIVCYANDGCCLMANIQGAQIMTSQIPVTQDLILVIHNPGITRVVKASGTIEKTHAACVIILVSFQIQDVGSTLQFLRLTSQSQDEEERELHTISRD